MCQSLCNVLCASELQKVVFLAAKVGLLACVLPCIAVRFAARWGSFVVLMCVFHFALLGYGCTRGVCNGISLAERQTPDMRRKY